MINQIEDAIVDRIKESLSAAAAKVAVQKGADGIVQPAVYVSTESGKFGKISQATYEHELSLYVDIVFAYRGADDRDRRKGIYLLLEGVLQTLFLQRLGLAIKPILPKSWRNTTTEEYRQQGMLIFSLELATAYTISRVNEAEAEDLLAVGLNYYLTPGDDAVDAVDLVTLSS